MRVVFDTNIFISALIFPRGQGEKALLRVIEGRDRLIISRDILDELLGVLARKFARDREELARVAVFITELGELISPRRSFRVLKDGSDNRILECAVAGHADAIVTGDREMLRLGGFEDVRILTLRQYLES